MASRWSWTSLVGLAVLAAVPVSAQIGAPTRSPPLEGLAEGTGAPFPKGNNAALDRLPDWGGIWFALFDRPPGAQPSGPPPALPKLKGKYKEAYEQWRKEIAANNGVEKRNRSNCSPPGMPGIMQIGQYPFEFLFTPGRVTINQEAWMQTRKIWTDGRKHLDDPDPSYMGDSVGHWEGDTLVAVTLFVNDMLPLANGMTHSPKMRITERIRLSPDDPDLLLNEMTIEDPEALEEPFTRTVRYRRDRYGLLIEFQCSENDRNPVDAEGHTQYH